MKKIGILTSGGDAPGMNAAIRAVVRSACSQGMEVAGIQRGFRGLIDDQIESMDMRSVSDIVQRGGTMLKTARCLEFKTPEGQARGAEIIEKHGIEGVVVIGGDGSFHGAEVLTKMGIPSIGIPGTIDNDLAYTEFTLGFDTACNTCLDAINKIRDTINSHERVSIVSVMGRHCGDLALYSGITGGAEVILVPEVEWDIEHVVRRLTDSQSRGKRSGIIVMAEGCGDPYELEHALSEASDFSVRTTVLGHTQRGGSPTMADRLLATRCGVRAVDLLRANTGNRVIGIRHNELIDLDISEALAMPKVFDKELYRISKLVSR